jgi:hypothetical protein
MEITGVTNIPRNRIAKLAGDSDPNMYVLRFNDTEVLRVWIDSKDYRVESMRIDSGTTWRMELLPETTTITFRMDGKIDLATQAIMGGMPKGVS